MGLRLHRLAPLYNVRFSGTIFTHANFLNACSIKLNILREVITTFFGLHYLRSFTQSWIWGFQRMLNGSFI